MQARGVKLLRAAAAFAPHRKQARLHAEAGASDHGRQHGGRGAAVPEDGCQARGGLTADRALDVAQPLADRPQRSHRHQLRARPTGRVLSVTLTQVQEPNPRTDKWPGVAAGQTAQHIEKQYLIRRSVALRSSSAACTHSCRRGRLKRERAAGRCARAIASSRAHLQVGHGSVADGRHRGLAHFLLRVRQPVHQRVQHLRPRRARVVPCPARMSQEQQRCSSRHATPVEWPFVHSQAVICNEYLPCLEELAALMGRRGGPRTRAREAEHEQLCSRAAESPSTVCRTSACTHGAQAGSHCATITLTAPALPHAHLHTLSACDQANASIATCPLACYLIL